MCILCPFSAVGTDGNVVVVRLLWMWVRREEVFTVTFIGQKCEGKNDVYENPIKGREIGLSSRQIDA